MNPGETLTRTWKGRRPRAIFQSRRCRTWHNAEALEEPPCVPPSQGGKKDETPPTFPPPAKGGFTSHPRVLGKQVNSVHAKRRSGCGERPRRGHASAAHSTDDSTERLGPIQPSGAEFAQPCHAHRRVPAQGDDLLEQPPCIQATIGHYGDRRSGIDLVGELSVTTSSARASRSERRLPRGLVEASGKDVQRKTKLKDKTLSGRRRSSHQRKATRGLGQVVTTQANDAAKQVVTSSSRRRCGPLGSRHVPFAEPLADRVEHRSIRGQRMLATAGSRCGSS